MAEENLNEDEAVEDVKKKKIPTVVIIAAVAVLMMAAGVFIGKMMFGGNGTANDKDKANVVQNGDNQKDQEDPDNKSAGENTEAENKGEDKAGDPEQNDGAGGEDKGTDQKKEDEGTQVKKTGKGNLRMEEFLVNLSDALARRYVKFIINLRLSKIEYVQKIKDDENLIPEIRDKIYELVADKSFTDLKSSAGKVMLKEEIMMSVNEILKESLNIEPVIKVMFSKFILQ